MSSSPRPTQKDIAREAGVTQATVSMALSDHQSVALKTREHIQAIAEKLGYHPDPFLSGLSAYRKKLRTSTFQGTLAWVTNYPADRDWRKSPPFLGYFHGASERADQLGYKVEEHSLRAQGMTSSRLEQILMARNIQGLLLAPQPSPDMALELSFARFSAVTFGYTLTKPQMHIVALQQFRSMETAFRKLISLGYRRPGLAIALDSDQRADRNWSAAFWSEQRELPREDRVPPLLAKKFTKEMFLAWFERYRPDVVLAMSTKVHQWMLEAGIPIPEAIGFALLTVPDEGRVYSGIWENPRVIGAKAVEFLIDLMHRNECGVPQVPLCLLVAGTWVDGKTVKIPQPPSRRAKAKLAGHSAP